MLGIDTNRVSVGMVDAHLQGAKKSATTRESQNHAAKLTQNCLPHLEGQAFVTRMG
jgi:hypothetical protein